jgi:peptide/nickel transport system permease protein
MVQFIIRRLFMLTPVMLGILLVTFTITRLVPGNPCDVMLGEKATEAKCEEFMHRYGLDKSLPKQFGLYIVNIVQGDFGDTIRDKRPVLDVIAERLPMTMELTFFAIMFSSTVGISLGILSAINRNSFWDTATMVVANMGVSMPVFWLGLLLAYMFALVLKDTPFYIPPSGRLTPGISLIPLSKVWGLEDLTGVRKFLLSLISNSAILNALLTKNFTLLKDALWHLILPSVAVGTISLATVARMTRSSLLDVLGQDYIRAARAKGLMERLVILRHGLRNALVPIVTIIGLQVGGLLSGAVLTETIFSLPGVGSRMVQGILSRDYPIVQGFSVVVAFIYVLTNLFVDISYAFLDPRIRLE